MSGNDDDDELFYRPKRHKSDNEQPSSFLPPHVTTVTDSTSQYAPPPLDSIQFSEQNWNVGQNFQQHSSSSAPGRKNPKGETLYDRLTALALPYTRKPKNNPNNHDSNGNQHMGGGNRKKSGYGQQQYNSSYPPSTQSSYQNCEENWDGDPDIPLIPPLMDEHSMPRKMKKNKNMSNPPLPPQDYQPPPPPPPLMPPEECQRPPPPPPQEYQAPIPPLMSPHEYQPTISPLMSSHEYQPSIPPLMSPHLQQLKQQHEQHVRNRSNNKKMNMNMWKTQNNINPNAPIPASCSLCMKNFESRKLIRLHLKSVHGITRDQDNYMRFIDEQIPNPYETSSTCSNNSNSSSSSNAGKIIVCRFRNCGQQCMDFNELRNHYEMYHQRASSFYCLAPFCKNQFATLMELDFHFSKIHPNAIDYLDKSKSSFQCQKSDCHRSFQTLEILKNHRQLAHKTSFPYYCHSDRNCNAEFHTRDQLDEHIRDFHPQSYPDDEDEMNNGVGSMDMDMNINMNPNFNNMKMNSNNNNNNNMTREENWKDPDFKSDEFITSNEPQSINKEKDLNTCHYRTCLEKFPTSELLSLHLCNAHGATFKCTVCHRQCTTAGGVLSHFNAKHDDLKDLLVKFINISPITTQKKNKNKDDITKRNNNNSANISPLVPNMDKFPCQDAKCPAVFRSLIHMKNHYQLKHKSKGRFNCCSDKICVAYFYTGVELELHLKTVHPTAYPVDISKSSVCFEIKCDVEDCSYSSKTEEEAEDHQRLHKGDSLDYKCEKEGCGVAFIKKQILIRHIRIIHKENKEETSKKKMHEVSAPSPEKFQQQNTTPEKIHQQNSSPEKIHQQNTTPEPNSIMSPTSKTSQVDFEHPVVVVVKQENEEIDDGERDNPEILKQEIKDEVKEELSDEEEGEVRDEEVVDEGIKKQEGEEIESKMEVRDDEEEDKGIIEHEEEENKGIIKHEEEEKESKVEVNHSEQHKIDNNDDADYSASNINNNPDANDTNTSS